MASSFSLVAPPASESRPKPARRRDPKPSLRIFYVQLKAVASEADLQALSGSLARLGVVDASGRGTEEDATAAWFELRLRRGVAEPVALYPRLVRVGVPTERVGRLTPIQPGEGSAQARQLPLLAEGTRP